jgi:DNA repair protein RecO (recombination protein O)
MKPLVTRGIVLKRTDFGEADRIITVLTPDHGKLRLMSKGVRRVKSKMAGGIELFSVSDLTYIRGRGDISTLVSARLIKYYDQIVHDIERVQLGYDLIKQLDRATEDAPEPEYFDLLQQSLEALDEAAIDLELIRIWFGAQLLRQAGFSPNLSTDTEGNKLAANQKYTFDFDHMSFAPAEAGQFKADHIKLLRLLFAGHAPQALAQVQGTAPLVTKIAPLVLAMQTAHLRI